MKQIKSFKINLILLCLTTILTACGSSTNLVMDSYDKRTPIPESEKIRVVFASDIPLIPENSVSIATIATNPETNCSTQSALEFLIEKTRELGANFLYIKAQQQQLVARYYGAFTKIVTCEVLYADFLEVK